MSTLNINDNNFLRQFEVNINGQLAKVEYALQERKIFLQKSFFQIIQLINLKRNF